MILQSRLYLGYISFADIVPKTGNKDGQSASTPEHTVVIRGGLLSYYKPVFLLLVSHLLHPYLTKASESLMRKYRLAEKLLDSTQKQLDEYLKLYNARFKTIKEIESELQLRNTSGYLKNLGHKYFTQNKKGLPPVQQMSLEQATKNMRKSREENSRGGGSGGKGKKKGSALFDSLNKGNHDEYDMKKELQEMN